MQPRFSKSYFIDELQAILKRIPTAPRKTGDEYDPKRAEIHRGYVDFHEKLLSRLQRVHGPMSRQSIYFLIRQRIEEEAAAHKLEGVAEAETYGQSDETCYAYGAQYAGWTLIDTYFDGC